MVGIIGRPTFVSGLSSGGVLSAWLSAYAKPHQVIAAHYEDPPLFASELHPSCGQSVRQSIGPVFALWSKFLGDQWSIGDWAGMVAAAPRELPTWMAALFAGTASSGPPQNLKENDPEWASAETVIARRLASNTDRGTFASRRIRPASPSDRR